MECVSFALRLLSRSQVEVPGGVVNLLLACTLPGEPIVLRPLKLLKLLCIIMLLREHALLEFEHIGRKLIYLLDDVLVLLLSTRFLIFSFRRHLVQLMTFILEGFCLDLF